MASALIHIAVAKKINEVLKFKDETKLFVGTVAPDLGKLLGDTKEAGHFETDNTYLPNLNKFLNKYKLDKEFELGYFIHLYTDLLWFDEFMLNYYKDHILYLNDGTKIEAEFWVKMRKVYDDYSVLNAKIIDIYNLDLDGFLNTYHVDSDITEVNLSEIRKLIEQIDGFIEESRINENELEVFTLDKIIWFIEDTAKRFIKEVRSGQFNISK